jgi:hypothetical protein
MNEQRQKIDYLAYCVEVYKQERGLSGRDVHRIFDRYNFFDYIMDLYEILHVNGTKYLMEELDEYQEHLDKNSGH